MPPRSGCAILLACLSVLLPAAAGRAQPAAGEAHKVLIVGASVSAGFVDPLRNRAGDRNETVPLLTLLRPWLAAERAVVSSRADIAMFVAPRDRGRTQIECACRASPTLVVAVDFLFWFGYGRMPAGSDEEAARLELLEDGLRLLAQLDCPVLVGDFPDMHGAAARMLPAALIPATATLSRLNQRLRAWAAERPQVRVLPLAELVQAMRTDGVELPLAGGPRRIPPGGLLQGDRLHATRLGMAWLAFRLQEHLHAALPADHPLRRARWALEQFVAAAGAEDELAVLTPVRAGGFAGGR